MSSQGNRAMQRFFPIRPMTDCLLFSLLQLTIGQGSYSTGSHLSTKSSEWYLYGRILDGRERTIHSLLSS